ncbi:uncharacterized protein HGUI_00815 [Hanseniaspora guilliermondii]|uniref:Uncharacterized protein n=1 Tax=Hanseniaspora guilliermondii TaxID=56406 RepID=A0A1L0CV19_9ASCO|nr:uncharacterized protein HGUI_00815 [Hanseniaspora guilliermondii]
MGLPTDNNPLFKKDNQSNVQNSIDEREKLFADKRDPTTHKFITNDGTEMTLKYNMNDINSYNTFANRQGSQNSENKEMMNLIDDEKRLQNLNNPWLTEAYDIAKKFYEADSKLDYQDRMHLSSIYAKIRDGQMKGMYGGILGTFTLPYLWIYHKNGGGGWSAFTKNGSNPATRLAFLNLNKKLPRLLVFSAFAMIIGGNLNGVRVYRQQVQKLENNLSRGNEGVYNQYQILQMTQALESYKWEHYFRITSIDPTRRLRDPRESIAPVLNKGEQHTKKKMDSGEPFKGGVMEKNVFNTIDVEKSEQELYEQTGQRQVNGVPVSPYSRRYKKQVEDEYTPQSNTDTANNMIDDADKEDPFFQKKKESKEKNGWWN